MRDYFSGGVSFGGGWGFYVSVLPKLFVYTMVYPFSCHQMRPGPCTFRRTRSTNHIVRILDLKPLIRYNFAVHLITERRTWWQLNGYILVTHHHHTSPHRDPDATQPSLIFVFHYSTIVSIEKRPERIEFH
jgi:hypothetical protein